MFGIKKIAEILLIFLVLFIIIVVFTGYGKILKESIMNFLGITTESERIHEGNIQADKEFENILNKINQCKDLKEDNCGCSFNIKNFKNNHMIISKVLDISLVDIGKMDKNEILKDVRSGNTIEKSSIQNSNCFFDKNLKKININVARVFFDKEKPYIHRTLGPFQTLLRKDEFFLNTEFPLYKKSQNELCWLSEDYKNSKECK